MKPSTEQRKKAQDLVDAYIITKLGTNIKTKGLYDAMQDAIALALHEAEEAGFRRGLGVAVEFAHERARIMNILGSDAKMKKNMTHAEIQSERVWEAQTIRDGIDALLKQQEGEK